jgi:hypothetical protein
MHSHHGLQSTARPVEDLVASYAPVKFPRASRWQAARTWLRLAAHPATVRRALFTAALVGIVLIAINHGDAILRGDLDRARIAKMLLTLVVPFTVSIVSSVSTRRELEQD